MLYSALKPFLFLFDPEVSHDLTLIMLNRVQQMGLLGAAPVYDFPGVKCFGLNFPHPIGLAAGLDKNASCVKAWETLGFGFIEVGTVTPKPQPGNPKPRLFRLPKYSAIINRMGFNNKGVDYCINNLKKVKVGCPVGVNIGKNKLTALSDAVQDYLFCYEKVHSFADYVTINISSPNTPGLRELQNTDELKGILQPLKESQVRFADQTNKHVPILVKIAPDLSDEALKQMIEVLIQLKIEGVIATNTTLDRSRVVDHPLSKEEGGLSGAPLFERSTEIVKLIYAQAGDTLPIIAVGGITDAASAQAKLKAGAKLIQLYTGLIYKGPSLIREIMRGLTYSSI